MAGTLTLRRAGAADAALLRAIRNDPDVRRTSWSTDLVGEREHAEWLSDALADPSRRLYVVLGGDGEAVGQVRLDRRTEQAAEISIDLLPGRRGQGLGRAAIELGREAAHGELGVAIVIAEVKLENAASLAAFAAAGFEEVRRTDTMVELHASR